MSVVIHMDAADFGRLMKASIPRAAIRIGPDRFQTGKINDESCVNLDWNWTALYWLGHDYSAVIIARAFLAALGWRYEVLWDTSAPMDQPQRGWCILTDYEEWKR